MPNAAISWSCKALVTESLKSASGVVGGFRLAATRQVNDTEHPKVVHNAPNFHVAPQEADLSLPLVPVLGQPGCLLRAGLNAKWTAVKRPVRAVGPDGFGDMDDRLGIDRD